MLSITLVTAFLGFMVALQFGVTKEDKPRDTRDIYQLQDDLTKAEKKHVQLNEQLSESNRLLEGYESDDTKSQLQTMKEALDKQKELAGETVKAGTGVLVTVQALAQGYSEAGEGLNADLIRRLINELNTLGATDIAIADERLTNRSPIRMVHEIVYVNDHPLPDLPFPIRVLTPHPSDLKKRLEVSESMEDFAREGLTMMVKVEDRLKLPANGESEKVEYMKPVKGD
ncbi:DUF881 domain-containing protein [Pullulanibacillus pueri]|nr:DUF881 domain-containing protein [Pullulanibacillus pueri]